MLTIGIVSIIILGLLLIYWEERKWSKDIEARQERIKKIIDDTENK